MSTLHDNDTTTNINNDNKLSYYPLDTTEPDDSNSNNNNNNDNPIQSMIISIDTAVERLHLGPFQYRILVASGLCFASDGMQMVLLSFVIPIVSTEWKLSSTQAAILTSMLFVGALMGTLILGPLADRRGRRFVFLTSAMMITCFGWSMALLAVNYATTLLSIVGIGVGVGGLVVPFDILAEVLPVEHRGTNLLRIEYFWTVGCLYVVALASLTLPHWRLLVVLTTLPCLLSCVVGYFVVPESPRWLLANGQAAQAMEILQQAAKLNHRGNVFERTTLLPEPADVSTFQDLFQPQWRETILRLWGAWAAFAFGYYGVLLATTRVFQSTTSPSLTTTTSFDYSAIFISSAAELVGTTLVLVLIDRVGRIPLQVGTYVLAGLMVGILCFGGEESPRWFRLLFGFGARVLEMAATCVTWVSTAEILTTQVRSTGHSTANAMARVGAFFCPFVVSTASLRQLGSIMVVVHAFTAVCVSKLPETKGMAMGHVVPAVELQSTEETDDLIEGNTDTGSSTRPGQVA